MAFASEPELLLARDAGLKLVSVAALVQRPLSSIIALGSRRITSVSALAGKRVGTAGLPYQAGELRAVLAHAGVDGAGVHEVRLGTALVPAMVSGSVDATLGGSWNYEAIQLALAHRNPTVIPVDRAGVPTYDGLLLVVREERGPHRRAGSARLPAGHHARRGRGCDPTRAAAVPLLTFCQPFAAGLACSSPRSSRRCLRRSPRMRATRSAGRNPARGPRSAAGCSPRACSSTTPAPACRRSATSSCPARGSRKMGAWPASHC